MLLFVMRHGPAQDVASSGRDEDRQLTEDGRARTLRVAHDLQRREACPARILSSPLRRCVQTAELVASVLAPGLQVELRRELAPGAGCSVVLAELMHARATRVMLVGHEPDLSRLTEGVLAHWSQGFDKAMVAALQIEVGDSIGDRFAYPDAHLQFLIDPAELG